MQNELAGVPRLAEADGVFFITLAKGDRLSIATTIERLIDMLDAMEPDPDMEPTLGWGVHGFPDNQSGIETDAVSLDECEDVCEDEGACVQSQPHDDDTDREPFLGWSEKCSQGARIGIGLEHDPAVQLLDMSEDDSGDIGELIFDATGYREANQMLRAKGHRGVYVSPGLWG